MRGGVGGILYSIRSGTPSFTHYDGRGDVTTKTNGAGAITWQSSYEAFGKRTQEQGSTQDRQKANTKEEDPTGLLNEGFRYRDLETGSFITRDPAGFVDGPNLYTYVRQNPWSKFDPEGLVSSDYKERLERADEQGRQIEAQRQEASNKANSDVNAAREAYGKGEITKEQLSSAESSARSQLLKTNKELRQQWERH